MSNLDKCVGVGSEILVAEGMHRFDHGLIVAVDKETEIPFAHVRLRGKSGDFLVRSGAYVPLKYCVELGEDVCAHFKKFAKEARKVRRTADKAFCKSVDEVQS